MVKIILTTSLRSEIGLFAAGLLRALISCSHASCISKRQKCSGWEHFHRNAV